MKARARSLTIMITLLALVCPASLAVGAPPPAGAYRLQRVEIMDRQGFGQPMVAATALIPVGWKAQGGVVWTPQVTCGLGFNFDWQASSADGVSAISFMPADRWESNNFGSASTTGCPVAAITSIQQYLQAFVEQYRAGARILDFRPRPDIARQFEHLNSVTPMASGELRSWVESGEVLIGYNTQGVEMRELISATTAFNYSRFDGGVGGSPLESLSGASFTNYSMRAPDGQLDFQLAEALRKAARPAPQWQAQINAHTAKISSINRKGAMDRAAITARTNEEIRQMQTDSWKRYNESSDRMQREATEAIRGVETYNDPYNGGTVELDNTYEQAWQLDDGTFVLTDDASFEPYRVFGQDGRQLAPSP